VFCPRPRWESSQQSTSPYNQNFGAFLKPKKRAKKLSRERKKKKKQKRQKEKKGKGREKERKGLSGFVSSGKNFL